MAAASSKVNAAKARRDPKTEILLRRIRNRIPDERRFEGLSQTLVGEGVDEFSTRELDAWLNSEVTSRTLDLLLIEATENESHGQQVRTLEEIERAAGLLIERLLPLGLPDSLEQQLLAQWVESSSESTHEQLGLLIAWEALKGRLATDLQKLLPAVASARVQLENHGGRKGKPENTWRSSTFTALAGRVRPLLAKQTNEHVSSVARQLWNLYFPWDPIMEVENAMQIVQRTTKANRPKT